MSALGRKRTPGTIPPRSWRRTVVFAVILSAPAVLLLALLVPTIGRIVAMNRLQAEFLAKWLDDHLSTLESTPPSVRVADGVTSIQGQESFVPLSLPRDARYLIYVFGASSVVLPSVDVSFPMQLETRLNGDGASFRVVNLGRAGATSGAILAMVRAALAVHAPDLIVFYGGHNDYNYSYRAAVLPAYGFIEGSPTLDFVVRSLLVPLFHLDDNLYWAMRSEHIDPRINRWLQRVGLLRIDPNLVDAIDAQAQRYFERNVEAIIAEAEKRGVPVLLITPVSNLEYEPFGVGTTALVEYQRGMESSDYTERIAHLDRARDLDAFNGVKRAKSGVAAYMRRRRARGVHVLDLEQRLIERRFEFGDGPFLDAMHLSPEAHAIIADYIHAHLIEESICCGLGGSGADPVGRIPEPLRFDQTNMDR